MLPKNTWLIVGMGLWLWWYNSDEQKQKRLTAETCAAAIDIALQTQIDESRAMTEDIRREQEILRQSQ